MKKFRCLSLVLAAVLLVMACADAKEVEIDYGDSAIYTKADIDAAIELIKAEFSKWKGCELHNIRYASDDCNSAASISWMNELNKGGRRTRSA